MEMTKLTIRPEIKEAWDRTAELLKNACKSTGEAVLQLKKTNVELAEKMEGIKIDDGIPGLQSLPDKCKFIKNVSNSIIDKDKMAGYLKGKPQPMDGLTVEHLLDMGYVGIYQWI